MDRVKLQAMLIEEEALRTRPYRDSKGKLTIGIRELAWTAGFLEGEGSFRHPVTGSVTSHVEACQVQREPLDRLHGMFGGYLNLRTRSKRDRGQAIWRWDLIGASAAGLMMTLYPLMSPRRQEQILKALREWRSRGPRNKYKTVCISGHPFDTENTRYYTNARTGKHGRFCRACKRERYGRRG